MENENVMEICDRSPLNITEFCHFFHKDLQNQASVWKDIFHQHNKFSSISESLHFETVHKMLHLHNLIREMAIENWEMAMGWS